MSELLQRLATLSPAKRELFLQKLPKREAKGSQSEVITQRGEPDCPPPLSFAQERLWFLDELDPGNVAYNIYPAFRLKGPLKTIALEQGLNEVFRRHESLRTNFVAIAGRVVQNIHPFNYVEIPLVDLTGLGKDEAYSEIQRLAIENAQRPFNLAQDRLLRVILARLSAEDHVMLLCAHHTVFDGWSLGVFWRELSLLYEAFSKGETSPLPELPIQYSDYVVWQRERLQGDLLDSHLSYWRRQLGGFPPMLDLPVDHPRPAVQSFDGATESCRFSESAMEALSSLARAEGATLFITLLAAFYALLYRYTGQEDILVGTPATGRNRTELEGLIGFFVNTLVLRSKITGEMRFRDLLAQTREFALDAQAHQDLPFEKLVNALKPERSLSNSPLFQAMFTFQNSIAESGSLPGLEVTALGIDRKTTVFDLVMSVVKSQQALTVSLVYRTDLFVARTAKRMLEHFKNLLEGILADPGQKISRLPLLTETERSQILAQSNSARPQFSGDLKSYPINQLFEDQVERAPDKVALSLSGENLTYRELNRRANRLAHYLCGLGVGPEIRVGIALERSIDSVVGMLGILKAGGVYLPLDPDYPEQHLAFIVEDARLHTLITQKGLTPTFSYPQLNVVHITEDWRAMASESDANLDCAVTPENLAYIIYTSGSTGRPKGVGVTHRASAEHFAAIQKVFNLASEDRVLQFASFSFDVSIEQTLPPMLAGAQVILRGSEVWTAEDFVAQTLEHGFTVVNFPTSYWHQLTQEGFNAAGPTSNHQLRLVIIGGDVILPQAVRKWRQTKMGEARLLNAYGPTESVITSTTFEIYQERGEAPSKQNIPIGRPVGNRAIYILDRDGNLAPVGTPGELYAGGSLLARCYINRPDLTAERFVPDPFSAEPGSRLYETGDQARRLPDGDLEFLGRVDHQVKIRGYRIELGEIEAALAQHPYVSEVVVTVQEAESGAKRLIAYVAARQSLTAHDLKRFLAEKLPDFMLPSVFMQLDRLPLSPNGKVDRRALPPVEIERHSSDEVFSAPQTEVEEALANIWAEVLGLERVGVTDNFFELGGDSILGIQIVARANRVGIHFTPKHLFQFQTIAQLAGVASSSRRSPSRQGPVSGPVPLTAIQRRFFDQTIPDRNHFNQAMLLELKPEIDLSLLERAFGHLLSHHDAFRLRFYHGDDGWRQVNLEREDKSVVRRIDLNRVADGELKSAIEAECEQLQRSLDISEGPVIRVGLMETGGGRNNRMVIVAHHLVIDGVSWRIVLEDLERAYAQLERGEEVDLGSKSLSFKEWSELEEEKANGEEIEREIRYWENEVGIREEDEEIRYEGNDYGSVEVVTVALSEEETRRLVKEAPRAYNTGMDEALMSGLVEGYRRWSGEREVIVDVERHGREGEEEEDVTRTVGWFTVIYPVKIRMEEGEEIGEVIKRVKERMRSAPGRGRGYGMMRYVSKKEDVRERTRRIRGGEISFNYLGQFDQVVGGGRKFERGRERSGQVCCPAGIRSHLIDVTAITIGGQLQVSWLYSKNLHSRADIECLARHFIDSLRRVIEHCLSSDAGGVTPSDFPEAGLNQEELEELLVELNDLAE